MLNWNGLADTRAAVTSLLTQTWQGLEVHVVDNASSGGDADALAREFGDRIVLRRHDRNLGFTGGHNGLLRELIARGDVDHVALLNNDAVAAPDWIERLVAAIEANATIGACASLMVFRENPGTVENAGIVMLRTGEAIPRGRGRPAREFASAADVAGVCGGAMIVRSAALRQVGVFRDEFFLNFEDVDLSLRLVATGWRCRYVPTAMVRHGLNQSIDKVRDDAFRIRSIRNMSVAYFVNMPWQVLVLTLPWQFVSWIVAPVAAALVGRPSFAKVLLLGRLRALREWRGLLRDRLALRPLRRAAWWRLFLMHGSSFAAYARFLRDVVLLRRREPMK
ncbi:MAG: glycosyltransferase family 2 protein [Planctomycetes bacterium]|nr:glycosyltransferase family 2 protein [Planctomycetota bacterium]